MVVFSCHLATPGYTAPACTAHACMCPAGRVLMLKLAEFCSKHPNRHKKPGQKADAGAGSSSSSAASSSKQSGKKGGKKKK